MPQTRESELTHVQASLVRNNGGGSPARVQAVPSPKADKNLMMMVKVAAGYNETPKGLHTPQQPGTNDMDSEQEQSLPRIDPESKAPILVNFSLHNPCKRTEPLMIRATDTAESVTSIVRSLFDIPVPIDLLFMGCRMQPVDELSYENLVENTDIKVTGLRPFEAPLICKWDGCTYQSIYFNQSILFLHVLEEHVKTSGVPGYNLCQYDKCGTGGRGLLYGSAYLPSHLRTHHFQLWGCDEPDCEEHDTRLDSGWHVRNKYEITYTQPSKKADEETKQNTSPAAPAMYLHYTISEDRCGGNEQVTSTILARLGERENRGVMLDSRRPHGDLSILQPASTKGTDRFAALR